ncbi:MAG: acyltransferase [Xanthomonadales bacterium]|nr:acyltransferase [Xanthomonadales bacterium]NIX13314.1 acyltransferase [Xanthomonadales bacterium]
MKGIGALLVLALSTIVLTVLICILAPGKFLAPAGAARDSIRKMLAGIAEAWVAVNNTALSRYAGTHWDIEIPQGLDRGGCYLVNCNHQSWVDIPVLQRCFNRRLPLLRFFLKSELIWVPFLGIAWWALDFPFMKRLSKEQLARRPWLKGRDLESARKACEKFRDIPVAMMNFPEGTRFSPDKRDARKSPYENLLVPRIGGMGQVLYALAEQLDALIDVTIAYPVKGRAGPAPNLWQLVSGQVPRIVVRARLREIPVQLRGRNFRTDLDARLELQTWINQLWAEKDTLVSGIMNQ